MSILATDSFTGSDHAGLGANWTTTTSLSAPEILTNAATNGSTPPCGARYSATSAPNDGYAKVKLTKLIATTDTGPGPAYRIASAASTFYFAQANTTETKLYKSVAGVFTQLGSNGVACANGDTLEIDCVGTSITVKKNGSTIIGPQTDSAIATGSAGIWLAGAGVAIEDVALDDFEMGDFGGGTSAKLLPPDNPRIKAQPITNRTYLEGVKLNLIGKDQFFTSPGRGPNYDWPNPRGYVFPVEDRGYVDPSETWNWGKDKFFAAPGQGPNYDYPNPRLRQFPIDGRTSTNTVNNTLLTAIAAPQAPFSTTDWPNPNRRTTPIESRTLLSWFMVDDTVPFAPQAVWPNPERRVFPLENRTQADGTEFWLFTPAVVNPFSQTNWPNPKPVSPVVDLRTIADGSEFWFLKDTFFGGAGQPPSPTPAVNPRGYPTPTDVRTWLQSHVLDTLAPITATPFSNTDWPNPGLKPFAIEDRTQADPSEFWLLKDTFFGGAGQPPSPTPAAPYRSATWPLDGRTWVQNHLQNTLAPLGPVPFYLTDWPVPARYRPVISLRTHAEFTRLLGKDKFFGAAGQPITIWPQPNPLGYRYPLDLRTGFARQTLTSTVAAMDASCIIRVGAEPWIFTVPSDPEGIIVAAEFRVVTDVDAEPQSAFIDTSWIQIGWTE